MREVGPLKTKELKSFQERHALQVDGKFGNQSMGEVLTLEAIIAGHKATITSMQKRLDEWERQYEELHASLRWEQTRSWWDKLVGG